MVRGMVSIIMPAYNAEAYLPRSIRSIQAQTYDAWELLIVDDGSSDRTREVVAEFAKKDERVKLLCNKHGGTARARNTALDAMQGEYVAFIDADDAYHPSYLKKLMSVMAADHSDMSICGIFKGVDYEEFLALPLKDETACIDMDTAFTRMYDNEWPLMISPWNKLYKKKLFETLRFPDGCYFEDASTTNLAVFQCNKISVLKAEMYFYNITPNSSSKTMRSVELLDREKALRSHWEYFLSNGRRDLAYKAIPFYLEQLIGIDYKIGRSDRPEDCAIIRDRFISTYRKYWRKCYTSKERAEKIFDFRYPTLGSVRYLIRRDGCVKTLTRFVKKRLGFKDERKA